VLKTIISFPVALRLAMTAGDAQVHHYAMANALVEIVWLAAGAILFFMSEQIANFLFADGEPLAISASAPELQRIGFSVIAVYFGVGSLAELFRFAYLYVRERPVDTFPTDTFMVRYGDHLLSTIAEAIISIALFFGSRQLSDFWHRLRAREMPADVGPEDEPVAPEE